MAEALLTVFASKILDSYNSFYFSGDFLSVLSLAGIVLYFVTSSDSGSLVIDCLSANGHPDPPMLQRIFWALTEGATATALLVSGGDQALTALRTVSIAAGLPYTIVLNFMCLALWRAVRIDAGDLDPNGPKFAIDLISFFSSFKRLFKFLIAILIPWFYMGRAYSRLQKCSPLPSMITLAVIFYAWIILCVLELVHTGLFYVGWTVYFFWATFASSIRIKMRTEYEINGNMVEDWFSVFLLYPAAAVQMDAHMEAVLNDEYIKKNDIPLSHPSKSISTTHMLDSSADENDNGAVNVAYIGDGSNKLDLSSQL